ncbi:hypothetical protein CYY_008698 [Polysphondylium violaceum]|uniref:Corrinoid adenosyltransferase MMAB n=1 Tax=Polysphondylium violaceum TaxID=133409 RepID=A0A8J4PML3_9MYCE|nr:hypothetical protein CYY_008698 [Polysphondylium violaceum]
MIKHSLSFINKLNSPRLIINNYSCSRLNNSSNNLYNYSNSKLYCTTSTENNSSNSNDHHSRIYTKTGDKGTSSLFNGERRAKNDHVFCVLGSVDELSAHIGVAKEYYLNLQYSGTNEKVRECKDQMVQQLEEIQCLLLDVGSHIATPKDSADAFLKRSPFADYHVESVEHWIDAMDVHLPPLRNFILPGGNLQSAQFHVCRSVCRRAERDLVSLDHVDTVNPSVMKYVNRLSDYFFTVARFCVFLTNSQEAVYKRPKVPSEHESKYQRHLEKR